MPNDHLQVYFKFRDNTFKYVVRAHTEIPNVPFGAGQGSVWRVERTIINDGTITTYSEHLCGTDWIRGHLYYDAITNQRLGTATPLEIKILNDSHFKVK
ncbi:hypothetical protein ASE40_21605 [Flavobacterium sp. Root935]|jgi:hypothetical protein|uniref:hypothetical protein n=1 Tax=Flavobacterium sp. Root935 TaxID=1736610 RepID=UPI00070AB14F|nr:hypothetical protein [Flavobacterium sp. Root935]KRD63490.1 hypothetical protein ASE40_21605 [Flavobacterium sp. Root935]